MTGAAVGADGAWSGMTMTEGAGCCCCFESLVAFSSKSVSELKREGQGKGEGANFRLKNDLGATARDVDREPLAAEVPCVDVSLADVVDGRRGREVDRLADAVVDEALERRLHEDVLADEDVAADDERLADGLWQLRDALAGPSFDDLIEDALAGLSDQPRLVESRDELRADVRQEDVAFLLLDTARVRECEDRLAAVTLAASDSADGARRCDRRLGGVADPVVLDPFDDVRPLDVWPAKVGLVRLKRGRRNPSDVLRVVDAAVDRLERPALLCQGDRRHHGVVPDELHHLTAEVEALAGPVPHAQAVSEVGEAHDADADPPRLARCLAQLWHGGHVRVRFDDVVQEPRHDHRRRRERLPVDLPLVEEPRQVQRPEATILCGAKPLLPARVRCLEGVKMSDGVGPVRRVEEQDARLAVLVGMAAQVVEQLRRLHRLDDLLGARVDELKVAGIADRLHELVGDADADVEVGQASFFFLAADELLDVRVIHPQDGHVRAAPGSCGFHPRVRFWKGKGKVHWIPDLELGKGKRERETDLLGRWRRKQRRRL